MSRGLTPAKVLEQADAIADGDVSDLSVDVQSLAATYRHKRETGSDLARLAHGQALVKRAAAEGHEAEPKSTGGASKPKKADLRKRVDDLGLEVPASATVAELEAALAAHDDQG